MPLWSPPVLIIEHFTFNAALRQELILKNYIDSLFLSRDVQTKVNAALMWYENNFLIYSTYLIVRRHENVLQKVMINNKINFKNSVTNHVFERLIII